MSQNTERFTGRVGDYERYRSRYPAQVIDILAQRCGLTREAHVADIGAGTGMLSELFLEYGNALVAVEPNDEMRAACKHLAHAWPGMLVKEGTAEANGLEEASVDFVVAGRAFHWFDPVSAKEEFQRILRPGGWVVLVSNSRVRDESPQSVAFEALLREYGTDYEANYQRYKITPRIDAFFAGGDLFREEIAGEQRLTLEELIGLTQSFSVSPVPGDPRHAGMQKALEAFFSRWQKEGVVVITTLCKLSCGRFSAWSHG
ncbi:MAG TPA: class I SAM-dependent methyltransferase [Edaphobacter sp.]|nr:class I SAM-dependent methyltransferase [Edaphobacter sp.]